MNPTILLTGATGNTGQVVAAELQRRSIPFVAMVRGEANRKKLEAQSIATVRGDFDDPPTLEKALDGIGKAYLVCTPDEQLVRRETAFVAAAKKAGVRHVVKCSAYSAGLDGPTKNLRSHGEVERALRESGLAWTFVRPHAFMQTSALIGWDMMVRSGAISFPAGDGGVPMVDVRDVAAVIVKALTEPGHEGKAYDLTGPEALTYDQQAEIFTRVLGREITYVPGSERELEMMLSFMGATEAPREHVVVIARMIREHRFEHVHSTLADLGIRPTTFEQCLRDVVEGRTGGGNSFQPPDTLAFRAMGHVAALMMRVRAWLRRRELAKAKVAAEPT